MSCSPPPEDGWRRLVLACSLLAGACGGGVEDGFDERVGVSEDPLVVCPDGPTVRGIDVSYYQGNVNWQAVKDSGRVFAFARVNHGDFIDPEFEDNWNGMKNAGLVRGAYQYFDPGGNAGAQAQILIDRVGMLGPGDLPAVLDVEETDGQSPATIASKIANWMEKVEAGTGKKPIIYTGKYFWQSNVSSGAFDDHPLWIANWYTECPDLPNAWNEWFFWQHSATGSVPGIAGDVDLDRFNGSLADLEAFAGKVFAAEIVEIEHPATMEAGEEATAHIVLRNVGGKTWGPKVALGTTKPRDRESPFWHDSWIDPATPAAVTDKVPPGSELVLAISLHAPDVSGSYIEHFNLVHAEAGWFSDPPQGGPKDGALALAIEVVGGAAQPPPQEEKPEVAVIAVSDEPEAASCQQGPAPSSARVGWLALAIVAAARRRRVRGSPGASP